jgi:hypothetical protein
VITNESISLRLAKVVRSHLMESNLPYEELAEEVATAFADNLKLDPTAEWASVHTFNLSIAVVARCVSRAFVGLPLCMFLAPTPTP